jgi:SAM-dependent methyltransferase
VAVHWRFDKPQSDILSGALNKVEGWFGASEGEDNNIRAHVDGVEIAVSTFPRPDVTRAHPDLNAVGFGAVIDIRHFTNSTVELTVTAGKHITSKQFRVTNQAIEQASSWDRTKRRKRERLVGLLRCPICACTIGITFVCAGCGRAYSVKEGAMDLLPPEMSAAFKIDPTSNVSAHPYSTEIKDILSETKDRGGLTIDCGAGYRFEISEDIICLEIVPYPSTDVLGVGQSLPFADNTFDTALSTAVLEHVTDPFLCASEIIRVVKPGGVIFCTVPFLQPEHGYPYHYYNMTMDGLVNLFGNRVKIERKMIPDWGHPLLSLAWFLSEYLRYLPSEHAAKFEHLTVRDLLQLRKNKNDPLFSMLSEEGRRVLAASTAIVARKL